VLSEFVQNAGIVALLLGLMLLFVMLVLGMIVVIRARKEDLPEVVHATVSPSGSVEAGSSPTYNSRGSKPRPYRQMAQPTEPRAPQTAARPVAAAECPVMPRWVWQVSPSCGSLAGAIGGCRSAAIDSLRLGA